MAMDFPSSPALDQKFTVAGIVYTWNGYAWSGGGLSNAVQKSGDTMSGALAIAAATASTSPTTGALTVAGGGGVGGALNVAGNLVAPNLIATSALTTQGWGGNTADGLIFWGSSGTNYISYVGGIYRFVGGPVGIVDTTPSTSPTTGALTVAGGVGITGALFGSTSQFSQGTFTRAGTIGAMLVVNDTSAGSVSQVAVLFQRAGATAGHITTAGPVTSYNTTSDGRLKEELQPFDSGAMIDTLEAWSFRWRANGEQAYGVVAQDAAKVMPQACVYDEGSDRWGTDYSKFVPLLLAEMKALRLRVAELEDRER